MRRILVTSALPYANGPIHIGHLVEYLQTDIWVRFQKLMGNRCVYVCADDTHGTAISLTAESKGVSELDVIQTAAEEHIRDFTGFGIEFDNYGSTHSEENEGLCGIIWHALNEAGLIVDKEVDQFFDTERGQFLADRYIRGTCPSCSATDQPGDNCSKCGATYSPTDLVDPFSVLSGSRPELRAAPHKFVRIEDSREFLTEWVQSGAVTKESANYLLNFFLNETDPETGEVKPKELQDWDVSRPAPYFGFEIPDFPGNYWYVWFDAPIGYMASTAQWCAANEEDFDDWWKNDEVEIHHFIGKDIQRFHCLCWPVMLKTAGFSLPTHVHIHGFLTVDGEKMSKTKGTFICASKYLEHLDPSYLRYYYATKLSSKVEDMDLNTDEFVERVNSDLVGKFVNLASRSAKFVKDTGLSQHYPEDEGLFAEFAQAGYAIARDYESGDYSRAMRRIIELADKANPYVERKAPWELKKDPSKAQELQDVCTVALNLFRQLAIYLAPVLPDVARKAGDLLEDPIISWDQSQEPLVDRPVGKFKHMLQRVDPEAVQKMIEESKDEAAQLEHQVVATDAASAKWLEEEPIAEQITIDDFAKVDLRVARILEAKEVHDER